MNQETKQVFICYAREDWKMAERLYTDLERAGVSPWLDRKKLLPGQKWKVAIRQAMQHSAYVMVLLSSHSVSKRGYMQKELKDALDLLKEFPASDIFLIPVRVAECCPVEEGLTELHWVDLFPSYTEGFAKICQAIGATPPVTKLAGQRFTWNTWPGILTILFVLASGLLLAGILFNNKTVRSYFFARPTLIPTPTATARPTITPTITPIVAPITRLRSKPMEVSVLDADKVFELTSRKFDWGTGWAPRAYIENQYDDQGEVVVDYATSLMWQKSGSDDSMTYQDAQKYIQELNRQKFAGYDDWRLPTVPELMSLLEPEPQANGLYINPIFDKRQRWCWSADLQTKGESSSGAAWNVGFDGGGVYWSFLDRKYYVRGVRS